MQVVLNEAQRDAVSWYFSNDNHDGEPWPLDEPVELEVEDGELVINGAFLHPDGEWATFSSAEGPYSSKRADAPAREFTMLERTLVDAARLRGEPENQFTPGELAAYSGRHALGVGKSLAGLQTAGYAVRTVTPGLGRPDEVHYALTPAGFQRALDLTGGYGLL